MIYEALDCIAEDMNDYFKQKLNLTENKVVLSGLVNAEGKIAVGGQNKLVLTLINIENDANAKGSVGSSIRNFGNGSSSLVFNLQVLVSAYFDDNNYEEALRFISFAIAYLQEKNVFTSQNTPRMDARLDKLVFEIENPGFDKMSNIWSTIGAKYMPSVVYKIRMLTFNNSIIKTYTPRIAGLENNM